MTTYNEAKRYAEALRKDGYTGSAFIMTNGTRYAVAKGFEEKAYAEKNGFRLATE